MPHDANANPLWTRSRRSGYCINSVAASDDGRLVASGTFLSAITVRSSNSLSVDAGGRWLAPVDGHPDGTAGHFCLWDAASGDLPWPSTISDMRWRMHLAAAGPVAAAGSVHGEVYLSTAGA